MRQIKFRYWNSFNAVMQYCDTEWKDYLSKFFIEHDHALEGENNPILMQFTGLIDRNGKEAYEGDLYKTPHSKLIYQIFFISGSFCGGTTSRACMPLGWDCAEIDKSFEFEIIGNIHENPELCAQ